MRLRKINQGGVVKSITAKLVKIASMDVYVQGFDYPRKLDTISDLANSVSYELPYKGLPEDEKKELSSVGVVPILQADGDDYFESKGTINFYTAGLKPERIKEWLAIILDQLKKDGAEKIGPTRVEKSGVYKSEVIRIPIGNIVKKEVITPPELNMANANAVHVFQNILKYNISEGSLHDVDAAELIKKIDYYLGEKQLPETPNRGKVEKLMPWKQGVDEDFQKVDTLLGPMQEHKAEVTGN